MRELIDNYILQLFEGLFLSLTDSLSVFLNDAQALTAIFMLLYFALKAYEMMSADEPLRILPLLRPFALAMVIIFWGDFVSVINFPIESITDKGRALFRDRVTVVDNLTIERMMLIDQVGMKLIESSTELEQVAAGGKDDSWFETLGIDFSSLFDSMKGYFVIIMAKFRFYAIQVVEFLVVTIFQVCSYAIFFIQVIFAGILIILGPFSFAMSVLPAFRDSYSQWIARYISVSLYSVIGYIIMSMCMVIIQYGLEREIDFLKYVMGNEEAFILYVATNDGGMNMYIISLLLGALTMLTIPVISTWIINTSGIGNAIGLMTYGAARLAKGIKK